jgi:hypothetical protein
MDKGKLTGSDKIWAAGEAIKLLRDSMFVFDGKPDPNIPMNREKFNSAFETALEKLQEGLDEI